MRRNGLALEYSPCTILFGITSVFPSYKPGLAWQWSMSSVEFNVGRDGDAEAYDRARNHEPQVPSQHHSGIWRYKRMANHAMNMVDSRQQHLSVSPFSFGKPRLGTLIKTHCLNCRFPRGTQNYHKPQARVYPHAFTCQAKGPAISPADHDTLPNLDITTPFSLPTAQMYIHAKPTRFIEKRETQAVPHTQSNPQIRGASRRKSDDGSSSPFAGAILQRTLLASPGLDVVRYFALFVSSP